MRAIFYILFTKLCQIAFCFYRILLNLCHRLNIVQGPHKAYLVKTPLLPAIFEFADLIDCRIESRPRVPISLSSGR